MIDGRGTEVNESLTDTAVGIGSVAATTRVGFAVVVPGAKVGDFVVPQIGALESGLQFDGAVVTGDDAVTVYLYNRTAGALPAAATTVGAMVLQTEN